MKNILKKKALPLGIGFLISLGLMTACMAAKANHPSTPATPVITKTTNNYPTTLPTTVTNVPTTVDTSDNGPVNINPNFNPDGHVDRPNVHLPGHHHHH